MAVVVDNVPEYDRLPEFIKDRVTMYFVAIIQWWRIQQHDAPYHWAWGYSNPTLVCASCRVPLVLAELAMDLSDSNHTNLVCFECVEVQYLVANPEDDRHLLLDPFRGCFEQAYLDENPDVVPPPELGPFR